MSYVIVERMFDYLQLLLLGAIAGFTIFLGLPLAALQNVSAHKKGFLNAVATGILVFLIIDVFSQAWETAGDATSNAFAGRAPAGDALTDLLALFGGLAVGLLGLVFYESKYMKANSEEAVRQQPEAFVESSSPEASPGGTIHIASQRMMEQADAYRLSMMIAIGIGAHNFSEGLAIGNRTLQGQLDLP